MFYSEYLVFGINFQIHFVSLIRLVSIHLLIDLSTHLCHHHRSRHPVLLHYFTARSKPTFSTNTSYINRHHGPLDWTGLRPICSPVPYRADYAVARCLSVRMSVCLSHAGILSKRSYIGLSSNFFHRWLVTPFKFFLQVVWKIRHFRPVSPRTMECE